MTTAKSLGGRLAYRPNLERADAQQLLPIFDSILPQSSVDAAAEEIRSWEAYEASPLIPLDQLCHELDLGRLWLKHEGDRQPTKSYKMLGTPYGVYRYLAQEIHRRTGLPEPSSKDIIDGGFRDLVAGLTVASATDGNHGFALAWSAKHFGCRAVVFVPSWVSPGRIQRLKQAGAQVEVVDGDYLAVDKVAADAAAQENWKIVSALASTGDTETPLDIMAGYSLVGRELVEAFPGTPKPTHVFVPCGAGILAIGVCMELVRAWGKQAPDFFPVEAEPTASMFRSKGLESPVVLQVDDEVVMGGLACGSTSFQTWPGLRYASTGFSSVSEDGVADALSLLKEKEGIITGETTMSTVMTIIHAAHDPATRRLMGLDQSSRVVIVGTEGVVDPERYEVLTGIGLS